MKKVISLADSPVLSETPPSLKVCMMLLVIGGVSDVFCSGRLPRTQILGARVACYNRIPKQRCVILGSELREAADDLYDYRRTGSYAKKAVVTLLFRECLKAILWCVYAIGPIPMMKFSALCAKEHGVRSVVSMNPIMIDGTGMCGGCRLTVNGKMSFACVDGPEYDGAAVDFDSLTERNRMYGEFERAAYEKECNLLKKGENNR